MAVTYVKDRYPWSPAEYVRVAVLFLLTAAAFFGGLAINALPLVYVGTALLGFLTVYYIYKNTQRKTHRVLNVQLNDESGHFSVWMNKENTALWGDKLKRERNQGSLNDLHGIGYQQVGIYGVYVFSLKGGKNLYLPERGMKPEVAEFFRNWLTGRTVNFLDKETQGRLTEAGALPSVKSA
jgi:hypothetical protein